MQKMPLSFLEEYIQQNVLPYYANTHSTSSACAQQTGLYRQQARNIIRECVNAGPDDVVIFTGAGTTAAIHKIIHALGLQDPVEAHNTVVFMGPFEHHSNILPWKETGAKIVRIKDTASGLVDFSDLCEKLAQHKDSNHQLIGSFSAASNVTGIQTDTVAVAELLHKYGALSLWDYACAGKVYIDHIGFCQWGYASTEYTYTTNIRNKIWEPNNRCS